MTIGTSIATVIFAIFDDRVRERNYTQARLTSTFHLGNSRHGGFFVSYLNILTYECTFRYRSLGIFTISICRKMREVARTNL